MANVSSFSGAMPVIPGGLVELGYSQITSTVTVSNATAGTGTEIIAPLTVNCDGGPMMVEFFAPQVTPNATAADSLFFSLFVDSAENDRYWGTFSTAAGTNQDNKPAYLVRRLTPSAGSHTFGVKAFVTNSARVGYVTVGAGGTVQAPGFLRVSKIVNQNDGLKPFWTPPVVTSLPSQATEGDQVLLYSSSPYAGYQTHQYVTGAWRTLADSRVATAWQSYTPALTAVTTNPTLGTGSSASGTYCQNGKIVHAEFRIKFGTSGTNAGSGIYSVSLPAPSASTTRPVGSWFGQDESAGARTTGVAYISNDTSKIELVFTGASSFPQATSALPWAWAASDLLWGTVTYEAA